MDCATLGDGQSCGSDAVAIFALFGITLDDRCLPSGYTPAQITSAYGLSGISFTSSSGTKVTGDGSGQTIALIEMYSDPNIQASLERIRCAVRFTEHHAQRDQPGRLANRYRLGRGRVARRRVGARHGPRRQHRRDRGRPREYRLRRSLTNLMTAVQTANDTAGVTVVSMSWGFNEFSNEASYDSNFTTPGITYIASSGDSGAVEWPAVSPNVLAVGGTSLRSEQLGSL